MKPFAVIFLSPFKLKLRLRVLLKMIKRQVLISLARFLALSLLAKWALPEANDKMLHMCSLETHSCFTETKLLANQRRQMD